MNTDALIKSNACIERYFGIGDDHSPQVVTEVV
jgi:hypothetical protein